MATTDGVLMDAFAPPETPDPSRCGDATSADRDARAGHLDTAALVAQDAQDATDLDVDASLARVLRTPSFEALDAMSCSFVYTMQLTCSNVVSTVVTTRIVRADGSSRSNSGANSLGGRPNQETESASALASVYAPQASQPRKAPRRRRVGAAGSSKYQAQLPALRRSLPALPIPISRLNEELRQERDAFMKRLHRERQEKAELEAWAATKIQACYRGSRARPPAVAGAVAYATRQKPSTLASIRSELAGLQAQLSRTDGVAKEQEAGGGSASSSMSPWRKAVDDRARRKRELKARRERMRCAATLVQACVRRFLAQIEYAKLVARHLEAVYLRAVVKIQGVYRGYHLRSRILEVVSRVQQRSALQIQCLVRGVQARERACIMRFERKCQARQRAGLALEFSLPSRTTVRPAAAATAATPAPSRDFKTPAWERERFYLRVHNAALRLSANQARVSARLALLQTSSAATRRASSGSSSNRSGARRGSSTHAALRSRPASALAS